MAIICMKQRPSIYFFFFFNDTATTEIYTLSLHDALPILSSGLPKPENMRMVQGSPRYIVACGPRVYGKDRKSTRLNSSHGYISYAVFCLKKKKKTATESYSSQPPPSLSHTLQSRQSSRRS